MQVEHTNLPQQRERRRLARRPRAVGSVAVAGHDRRQRRRHPENPAQVLAPEKLGRFVDKGRADGQAGLQHLDEAVAVGGGHAAALEAALELAEEAGNVRRHVACVPEDDVRPREASQPATRDACRQVDAHDERHRRGAPELLIARVLGVREKVAEAAPLLVAQVEERSLLEDGDRKPV